MRPSWDDGRYDSGTQWTAGWVRERSSVKAERMRFYVLALKTVAGISLKIDLVQGWLYQLAAVELLETPRTHLLSHPGLGIGAAVRPVTVPQFGGLEC